MTNEIKARLVCIIIFFKKTTFKPAIKNQKKWIKNPLFFGRSMGFEPTTPGTTNQCSNQLS